MTTGSSGATRALSRTPTSDAVSEFRSSSGFALYRGLKNMLRCDEAEVVRGIADYVISQHRGLRLLSGLIERTRDSPIPGVVALIGWLRAFASVRSPARPNGCAWIARLSNERQAIEAVRCLAGDLSWTELEFGLRPDIAALRGLTRNFAPRHIFKLVRRLHRRHEFFRVLRVIEFIAYYTRYFEIFQTGGFKLAVTSNHSNPHGLAFNLAARKRNIPVVLITHGMPVRPVALLTYDLAVVHCEAARQTYLEEGCRIFRVLVHGRRRHYRPMPSERLPERLTVGIFLCKEVNEACLKDTVAGLLRQPKVARILIRPHPKNLWRGLNEWIATHNDARVGLAAGHSVLGDIESVSIVLAGNSSVLVDAVTAGRPSGYVFGLDYGPQDLHHFVRCGLIYPLEDRDGHHRWNSEVMLAFYQRPEWLHVLRLFANINEDDTEVAAQALQIIRELSGNEIA